MMNGLTSIFAVNNAPPPHATIAGLAIVRGGVRNSSAEYRLMKSRWPGGPPPPLQVYGANTSSATTDTATAANVSTRHGWPRSLDPSHIRIATSPGKKYGTNPKCRPTKKYSTLCVNLLEKSLKTLSASESLVLCCAAAAQTFSRDASNGNFV